MAFVRRWQALIGGVIVSVILGGLGLAQGVSAAKTLVAYSIVIAFTFTISLLQGRSEILAVFAGNPADERQQLIHLRALAMAAEIAVVVALAGFVLAEMTGRDSTGFAIVAATLGFGYMGSVLWLRLRL
jgi:Na+/H+ antiporter NhaD/arsenite permease-like protein